MPFRLTGKLRETLIKSEFPMATACRSDLKNQRPLVDFAVRGAQESAAGGRGFPRTQPAFVLPAMGEDGPLSRRLSSLAEDQQSRGQIEAEACVIDGPCARAKKGALELGKLSGAGVRSSWRWPSARAFLSLSARALLRLTRSCSSSQRLALNALMSPPATPRTSSAPSTPQTRSRPCIASSASGPRPKVASPTS